MPKPEIPTARARPGWRTASAPAFLPVLVAAALLGCAHALTPAQQQLKKGGDCAALLRAADQARAQALPDVAQQLAQGCDQDRFLALVAAATPAQALLWCGRARAAQQGSGHPPGCDGAQVRELQQQLRPHITIGPSEPEPAPDPALLAALAVVGAELNFAWDNDDPMVIVGSLEVRVEHQQTESYSAVPDQTGRRRSIPAVQHRFVARAEAEAEIAGRTRTLRTSEEARDATWDAVPRLGIQARTVPEVPSDQELSTRAAIDWLRALARDLAATPPEGVDTDDAAGCVAYAEALRAETGDPDAAMDGSGDAAEVAACERLLGMPAGAGIPAP